MFKGGDGLTVNAPVQPLGKIRKVSRVATERIEPKQLLPLLGAVCARLSQLAVLFVLASISNSVERDSAVVGFAVVSAAGMLTDSGAANFLLTRAQGELDRSLYLTALLTQLTFAVSGGFFALGYAYFIVGVPPAVKWTILLLCLTQIADSVGRVARSYFLAIGKTVQFATPEFITAAARFGGVIGFILSPAAFAWVIPASVTIIVSVYVSRHCYVLIPSAGGNSIGSTVRRIVSYGVSGATSVLYSQAPLLIAPAVLNSGSAAYFAFVIRLVQPLEIVPATLSMQILPRLTSATTSRRKLFLHVWFGFSALGLAAFILLVCTIPWVVDVVSDFPSSITVVVLLASAAVFKYGNYGLVSEILSLEMTAARTYCNLLVAAVIVPACVVAAIAYGLNGLALTVAVGEAFLAVVLGLCLRHSFIKGVK